MIRSCISGSDFNATVLETVVPPNSEGVAGFFPFEIAILPDSNLETVEVLLVLLDVVSHANETVIIPSLALELCRLARIVRLSWWLSLAHMSHPSTKSHAYMS